MTEEFTTIIYRDSDGFNSKGFGAYTIGTRSEWHEKSAEGMAQKLVESDVPRELIRFDTSGTSRGLSETAIAKLNAALDSAYA